MSLKPFDVEISDVILQGARRRAQREGKRLEVVLENFVETYAALNTADTITYEVQSGDTLTKIARKFYGDARKYPLIQQANNIDQAGTIWVGQILTIPSAGSNTPAPATSPDTSTSPAPTPESGTSQPQPTPPSNVPANAELLNGDFESFQPFVYKGAPKVWKGRYREEVGAGWQAKIISGVKKKRIRFLSSLVFGQVAKDLYGGSGLNYAYGGGNSQVIISQYGYDAVLYQTIAAQPGKTYRFSGLIVSFYKGTDNPATPNKIFKTLGIDPTGGQDYRSSAIVWGDRDSTDHAWINPSVSAQAQSNAITVFIRIENTEKNVGVTELNIVHLDKFLLE